MKAKDTESSDWPEGEPSAEQKVTLEDYQQLIMQMRRRETVLCNENFQRPKAFEMGKPFCGR